MILIAFGTRPEIIKLFPLVHELQREQVPFKTLFTGQHWDLYHDVKDLMPEPDYFIRKHCDSDLSLAESFCQICGSVEEVISERNPKIVVIQGDTTTACAVAQVAFYKKVKIGHIEAGLRTNDIISPFPEEANRRIISQLADINFAPTKIAYDNLTKEGARNVFLTGNTIVDAVDYFRLDRSFENIAVITIHRRENHKAIPSIFAELNLAAAKHPDIDFIFPLHPNPNVQQHKHLLVEKNLAVVEPLGYKEMLHNLSRARFIISDSGGLQEEAVCFGKKILIVRGTTERPETLETGLGRLVGLDIVPHLKWAMSKGDLPTTNPFGDGKSSIRIANIIRKVL